MTQRQLDEIGGRPRSPPRSCAARLLLGRRRPGLRQPLKNRGPKVSTPHQEEASFAVALADPDSGVRVSVDPVPTDVRLPIRETKSAAAQHRLPSLRAAAHAT